MKPSSPDLSRLLKDASTIGTLDSEGAFTIAGNAAIGKLAAFQLPRQSAWILKIVQAAVASESESLNIKQSHETTDFVFEPRREFDLAELKEALTSPQVNSAPEVEHLAVGLRAVGFGDERHFTLVFDSDGRRNMLAWDGTQLIESAEALDTSRSKILLLVAFPPEDMGRRFAGLAKSAGRASTEYLEVVQNGEVCPIPLLFDGRRIDAMAAPPAHKIDGKTVPLSVSWVPVSPRQRSGSLKLPQGIIDQADVQKPSDKFTDDRIFHLDGALDQTEISSLAKLRYSYKIVHYGSKHHNFEFRAINQLSEYTWIKHGVVCHREKSRYPTCPISFQVYLPADDLQTDVSGLTIQTSEFTEKRKTQARERLLFQLQNTLEALDNHFPKPFKHDAILGSGIAAICIFAAPLTLGKTLWGSAISLATIAHSASKKKQVMEDCKYQLRKMGDRLRFPEPSKPSS